MAVLTTLYGLVLANLVLVPLARLVARRAAAEEREREQVLDWLGSELASAIPRQDAARPPAPAPAPRRVGRG